jgi:hypothetical protein
VPKDKNFRILIFSFLTLATIYTMRIAKSKLKQIILEEYNKIFKEVKKLPRIRGPVSTTSTVAGEAAANLVRGAARQSGRTIGDITPLLPTSYLTRAQAAADVFGVGGPTDVDVVVPPENLGPTSETTMSWLRPTEEYPPTPIVQRRKTPLDPLPPGDAPVDPAWFDDLFNLKWDQIEKMPAGPRKDDLIGDFMKDLELAEKEHFEQIKYTPGAQTQTFVDPALRKKYFGAEPDLAYRRVTAPYDDMWRPHQGEYQYTPSQPYTMLGAGRWRRAYEIEGQPDKVLKTAIVGPAGDPGTRLHQAKAAIRSREMNKFEASAEYQQSPLAPKVFEAGPNHDYLVVEKVIPIKDWREMFQFFPNFKKYARKPSGRRRFMDPGRSWTNDISNLFPEILANNKPITKEEGVDWKLELVETLDHELRNIIAKESPDIPRWEEELGVRLQWGTEADSTIKFSPEADRLIKDLYELKKDPAVNLLYQYQLITSPRRRPGADFNLDEAINVLNELITDPQVSNLRDHASVYRSIGGASEGWLRYNDFRPGNVGYTIDPETGRKMFKVIDSGYKTNPVK